MTFGASISGTLDTAAVLGDGLIRTGPALDVVIVGAGIAGLTAGTLLADAGHHVRILEAQTRLGGRIYTHRYDDGRYAELGAMRFAPGHHNAHTLFKQFEIELAPFPLEYKEIHLGGRLSPATASLRDIGFDVERSAQELLDDTMAPAMAVFDEIADEEESFAVFMAKYDAYSIADYFAEQNLSNDEIAALAILNNIEGRMAFSFAEWATYVRDDAFGAGLTYAVDGIGQLCDRMAAKFCAAGGQILYGARVTEIDQTLTKVLVTIRQGSSTFGCQGDHVILTPPPIVLRHIRIEGMDGPKRQAIRAAYAGRAAKVFLQFSDRWWESRVGTEGGMVMTDLPSRNVVFTVAGQNAERRGQVIASYTWESDAMVLANLPVEQRCLQVLDDLARIYPDMPVRETYEGGVAHDWGSDPYAGGVGGLFRPHEMTSRHYRDLLQPVGRVWFAGETYDRRHRRWIEAAIRSAVKNVQAITTGEGRIQWLD
jgi:monoamine oxidase